MKRICAGAFAALCALPAAADDFAAACARLADQAQQRVVFLDAAPTRDDSRGVDTLKRLATDQTPPYHRVLGLTEAHSESQLELTSRVLSGRDGRSCAVAELRLTLRLAQLRVYLARELTDPCRRRIVEEHEQRHVAVWREHLRAGARLLETLLQQKLGQPAYFASAQAARDGVQRQAQELVAEQLARLGAGITAANRQIDSAASYQSDETRLRACP